MVFEAIEFAARAHRGQYRKATKIPYLMHPLSAARTVIDAGCAEEVVAAALLHDIVEDTSHTVEDIRAQFGPRVAELVEACSEPNHRDESWETRKQQTIDMLAACTDQDVLVVAIADKLDNLRSIREDLALRGEDTWKKFKRGRDKQEWYYRSLNQAFQRQMRTDAGHRLAGLFQQEVTLVFGEAS
jgi:(p)ppGpp synthase/HD superfamily hydrolase